MTVRAVSAALVLAGSLLARAAGAQATPPAESPPSEVAPVPPSSSPVAPDPAAPVAAPGPPVPPSPHGWDDRGPIFHPDGPGEYRFRVAVGVQLDVLPAKVVESESRTKPLLTAGVRFGVPYGFSFALRLKTLATTNELAFAPRWAIRFGDVTLGVHDRIAFWYGVLPNGSASTRAHGFFDYPGLSVGVPWRDVRFSLEVELILGLSQEVTLGDSVDFGRNHLSFLGTSAVVTVENLLPWGGEWYYGAGIISAIPDYETWVAFSDVRARYPYPRFVAGYAF